MHDCGIYGMQEQAQAHLGRFWKSSRQGTTWALGRVSLWGRIVECEHGWRAQYAYPYELTVFTTSARLAGSVTDEYAVDVVRGHPAAVGRIAAALPADEDDWQRWFNQSIYGQMDRFVIVPRLAELRRDLEQIRTAVRRLDTAIPVKPEPKEPLARFGDDEVFAALQVAIARSRSEGAAASASNVCGVLSPKANHETRVLVGQALGRLARGGRVIRLRRKWDPGRGSAWSLPGLEIGAWWLKQYVVEGMVTPPDASV